MDESRETGGWPAHMASSPGPGRSHRRWVLAGVIGVVAVVAAAVVVGWLGSPMDWPPEGQDGQVTLVPQYTAGIEADTGETLWVAEGDLCAPRITSMVVDPRTGEGPWIRCRSTGSVTVQAEQVAGGEVDVVVEGFHPVTGEALWTTPVEGASAFYVDTTPLARLGPTTVAFTRDDGTLLALDAATGEIDEVDADEVGWCFGVNHYEQVNPDGEARDRVGEDYVAPCDAQGAPAPAPVVADEGVGVVAGDVFVWMDVSGLHGARITD